MKLLILLTLTALSSIVYAETQVVRMAMANSVNTSGLYAYLKPKIETSTQTTIQPTFSASGRAIRLARSGQADLIWVFSPEAEQKLIEDGHSLGRQSVMDNAFILVGPKNDPANIQGAANAIEAFKRIAQHQKGFASRGDDSGTHKKELQLWQLAQIDPLGREWYFETGANIRTNLTLAQKKQYYTLIDQASFISLEPSGLHALLTDEVYFENKYSVMLIKPSNQKANLKGALRVYEWLTSEEGLRAIGDYQYNGKTLFTPTRVSLKAEGN
jgi:tungstate transport system substrate-binding protein